MVNHKGNHKTNHKTNHNHKVKTNHKEKIKHAVKINHKAKAQPIHIMIATPTSLRKEVLGLAIDIIELLKRLREIKKNKQHKYDLMKELKQQVADIRKLNTKLLKSELPLDLDAVLALPKYKKQKEMIKKVEEARLKSQRHWTADELKIERDIALGPKVAPKVSKPVIEEAKHKAPPVFQPKTSDKLEADLEALREKMAQL